MFSCQIRSRRVRVITEVKSNLVESFLWMQNLDAEGIDDESPRGVRDTSWSAHMTDEFVESVEQKEGKKEYR